jgi:hypothetical protein
VLTPAQVALYRGLESPAFSLEAAVKLYEGRRNTPTAEEPIVRIAAKTEMSEELLGVFAAISDPKNEHLFKVETALKSLAHVQAPSQPE